MSGRPGGEDQGSLAPPRNAFRMPQGGYSRAGQPALHRLEAGRTVLVVDDRPENLYIISQVLEEYLPGCRVEAASSGAAALAAAGRLPLDGALVDVQMPGMDGFELCRRFKAEPHTAHVPVILITSHEGSSELRAQGLDAGADDFISRPMDNVELVARVRSILRIKSAEDELRNAAASLEELVTERTRQLSIEKERARQYLDQASSIFVGIDARGDVNLVNAKALQVLERRQEEVLGGNWFEAFVPPQCCEAMRVACRRVLDQGEPPEKGLECHLVSRSGASRLIHWQFSPIRDESQMITGVLCSGEDITERRRTEELLQKLAAAVEQTADAVIITDATGSIQYVNPAFEKMTGYGRSEVIGRNPRLLKSGKLSARFYRDVWTTIGSGQTWHGRFVNRKKDGTLYQEDCTISPVTSPDGEIVNFVAMKRDVTQELALTEQLHQSQKMESIGRLAGGIAHDFNNLLTPILGYAGLCLMELEGEHPHRQYLEIIQESAESAAAMTRQLLAFTRKQTVVSEVVSLNEKVAETGRMLRRIIGEDVELVTDLSPEAGNILADGSQIQQILMNLAANARDAMPRGGRLTIRTSRFDPEADLPPGSGEPRAGEYVLLSVSDTGCGMDEVTRSRLFEPFFTTKEPGKGTGLGLATVYWVVRQQKGSIEVDSQPEQGTTFRIYFPRVDEEPSTEEADAYSDLAAERDYSVLVVDDEEKILRMVCDVLTVYGYRPTAAASAEAALQAATRSPEEFHLLLADVVLPQMNGRELAEKLVQANPELRVLYMSGYTRQLLPEVASGESSVNFLRKPFSVETLLAKVKEALARTG